MQVVSTTPPRLSRRICPENEASRTRVEHETLEHRDNFPCLPCHPKKANPECQLRHLVLLRQSVAILGVIFTMLSSQLQVRPMRFLIHRTCSLEIYLLFLASELLLALRSPGLESSPGVIAVTRPLLAVLSLPIHISRLVSVVLKKVDVVLSKTHVPLGY